jgi:uncharacterized protein (UPF0548 family)
VFLTHKPTAAEIEEFISRQQNVRFSYADVGSTNGIQPPGYTVDRNRVQLGSGLQAFSQAVGRLRAWQMFKLRWVDLFPASPPIRVDQTVAVVVRHFGFWSMNACRIVYVIEGNRRFSFAYGTLQDHAEQGEERFSIEWLESDDSVWYSILAFSRPGKWQARIAKPLSRMLQKKFARDSLAAMRLGVRVW